MINFTYRTVNLISLRHSICGLHVVTNYDFPIYFSREDIKFWQDFLGLESIEEGKEYLIGKQVTFVVEEYEKTYYVLGIKEKDNVLEFKQMGLWMKKENITIDWSEA